MPREARYIPANSTVHIYCRGNNKMDIFHDLTDYSVYRSMTIKVLAEHPVEIYHYCLMPNHVHFLVQVKDENVSKFMQKLNLRYSFYYREKYNWHGYLWQGRFKSNVITTEQYLYACGIYIEENPVRAKLVQRVQEYIWSSCHYYLFSACDKLITVNPYYYALGDTDAERKRAYRRLSRFS